METAGRSARPAVVDASLGSSYCPMVNVTDVGDGV